MIKYFRRIRKALLTQNRFGKYLLYALGEIVLVVIGILLALQANNWNTTRKEAQQEQALLSELQLEYQGKLSELNEKIQLRNLIIKDTQTLLDIIAAKDRTVELDSIYLKLFLPIIIPTFDASNSVTEELISSGKLYIIKNHTLRKMISDWQPELAKMTEEEQNFRQVSFNSNFQVLGKYPMNNVIDAYYQAEMQADSLVYKSELVRKSFIKSTKLFDRELFFNDLATENVLGMTNFMHQVANRQATSLKNHIHKVQWLIEQELKRFETNYNALK